MVSPSGGNMDAYVRGLAVFESWLARKGLGEATSEAELLAANEDLREVLRDMLDADLTADDADLASTVPGASSVLPTAEQDFGDYRILECIGQGGMGTVYLAEHRDLGRRVALKVIRPERLFSSVVKDRFWREARAVAQLDHPNICPVFEVGEVGNVPFMAMRYLEGKTLAQIIATAQDGKRVFGAPSTAAASAASAAKTSSDDSLPATRSEIHAIVALIEDVARGLHAAHETGIIHRDIKPANILVTAEGRPMLLDFGLARAVEPDGGAEEPALTMTGDLPGTPLYMSPEQIQPDGRRLDRQTDVYSLAVTLYECLTLCRPFDGASIRELQDAILSAPLVRPRRRNAHVPRDLELVVEKAIDRDPDHRYRTAHEFAEDLRRVRSYEPILARRPGIGVRVGRWVQRYPWAALFLAVVTIFAGVSWRQWTLIADGKSEYDQMAWVVKLRDGEAAERAAYRERLRRIRDTRSRATRVDNRVFESWLQDHGRPAVAILKRFRDTMTGVSARLIGDAKSPRFHNEEDRFKYETLDALIVDAAGFVESEWGELERVKAHIAWNETVEAETIEAFREKWRAAAAAVAKNPKYHGLELAPQVGLVPLGADPSSSFEEFVHVRSGTTPGRDPSTGKLQFTKDTGLVFVLLPGGTFFMGAQRTDPNGQNYDKSARDHEKDVHAVTLGPFLLSKFEMSQAQWMRLNGGEQPSILRAGRKDKGGKTRGGGRVMTLEHPVEGVSWNKCDRCMVMFGLEIPTEAQWEYACRAGTDTPWFVGSNYLALEGHVNFADRSAARSGFSEIEDWPTLNDGYAAHAPVHTFLPNPFGLHHMCGNVWEYCREWYDLYSKPIQGDDGHRQTHGRQRVMRGSSFDRSHHQARSAYRSGMVPTARGGSNGLRPARTLDR
jgi:serine/threonine protein kinase/formylglycine-generating enzyme required for sulfatase activity